MFIIANAGVFAYMITAAGIPDAIGLWLTDILKSPAWFLLGVNAALFVIGMFIETSAAIIVLAPIWSRLPIHFGIDPVHFGIIMVVNLALGMITPPSESTCLPPARWPGSLSTRSSGTCSRSCW
jgi:TRAP-type C4-dicarboxylate transport system permease large subunit